MLKLERHGVQDHHRAIKIALPFLGVSNIIRLHHCVEDLFKKLCFLSNLSLCKNSKFSSKLRKIIYSKTTEIENNSELPDLLA